MVTAILDILCMYSYSMYSTNIHLSIDKPTVSIQREDSPVLEDGVGSSTLTCTSQANPPATVSWHKVGDKVTKQDTGQQEELYQQEQ